MRFISTLVVGLVCISSLKQIHNRVIFMADKIIRILCYFHLSFELF